MFDVRFSRSQGRTLILSEAGGKYTPHEAFARAMANDSTGAIEVVALGAIQLDQPILVTKSSIELVLPTGVYLKPAPTPIGVFDLSGNDVKIRGGGGFLVDSFVPGQTLIHSTGDNPVFDTLLFQVNTAAGNEASPMRLLRFQENNERVIHNCRFLPNRGVTCVSGYRGQGLRVSNSSFTNGRGTEVTDFATPHQQRQCYRVFDLEHDGWSHFMGNTFKGLGGSSFLPGSGQPMNALLRYQHTTGVAGQNEAGHIVWVGNRIEDCLASRPIWLRGCRWADFFASSFDNTNGEVFGTDHGMFVLEAEGGGAINQKCHDIKIVGCGFHNTAGNFDTQVLYLRAAERVKIQSCVFDVMRARYGINFHPDDCRSLTIQGNTFESAAESGVVLASPFDVQSAVRIQPGSNARYVITGNTTLGLTPAVGGEEVVSKAGAVTGTFIEADNHSL